MGCTSSAPSTLSANVSKEDKSIQFEEDVEETYSEHKATDTESENQTETKVLPNSDPTTSIQLVRNNQSTNSLEPGKDLNTNGNIEKSKRIDTNVVATILTQDEGKVDILTKLKLEEVVGKFIEITEDNENLVADNGPAGSTEKVIEETSTTIETEPNEHIENNAESEVSPSQSQSSRATRWEALADIAAELPPSLTVDPITGQIYSLSK